MFRKLIALSPLAVLCAIAGCIDDHPASTPPPAIVTKTITVNVPVVVRCIDPATVPELPDKVGSQFNGDPRHDLDVAVAALEVTRAALIDALGLIAPCTASSAVTTTTSP